MVLSGVRRPLQLQPTHEWASLVHLHRHAPTNEHTLTTQQQHERRQQEEGTQREATHSVVYPNSHTFLPLFCDPLLRFLSFVVLYACVSVGFVFPFLLRHCCVVRLMFFPAAFRRSQSKPIPIGQERKGTHTLREVLETNKQRACTKKEDPIESHRGRCCLASCHHSVGVWLSPGGMPQKQSLAHCRPEDYQHQATRMILNTHRQKHPYHH